MSYYARSYWTASGDQTDFTVGFPYLDKAHVQVSLNSIPTTFTWVNDSVVRLSPAPSAGTVVLVRRATSPEARLVDYVSPSSLNEDDLDNDSLQGFYLAQEAQDAASATVSDDPVTGQYTAGGKRLTNVADPVDDQDAATKAYVDSAPTSPVAQANAAAATATAAAATATTKASEASTSASNASASATAASGSAATATTKASEASTSATAASGSASTATTKASEASTSATNAAASASTATTKASEASASATAAAGSASAAATSASNAATSEANAAASAASIDPATLVKNTAQSLSETQRGQARANIGADLLGGFRNKLINPRFEVNQRGLSFGSVGFTSDRWRLETFGTGASGGAVNIAVNAATALAVGRKNVLVWDRSAATTISRLQQKIEGVHTLAGKTVTAAILCYTSGAPTDLTVRLDQDFGTGGSPSAYVTGTPQTQTIPGSTPVLLKYVFTLPSIAGKVLGNNNNDNLLFILDSPASGGFGIRLLEVALVEGDATAEADPFSPRHIQQELALCQRYYLKLDGGVVRQGQMSASATHNGNQSALWVSFPTTMRTTPSHTVVLYSADSAPNINLTPFGVLFARAFTAVGQYLYIDSGNCFDAEI